MPAGLPEIAYQLIHGAFTEEQRKGVFKPEVEVPDAPARDRFLAYTGRQPGRRTWNRPPVTSGRRGAGG